MGVRKEGRERDKHFYWYNVRAAHVTVYMIFYNHIQDLNGWRDR